MTDAQLLSVADSHLKGDVVKAVKLAKKNGHTPATWLELQTVLLTYFQDRRTHDDHRDELDRMKCVGVSGTDLKTYTSNFISKMLFIPDMSMSDKVYQYEKGLPEDVQKEVKRKKPANLEAAVGAAFEALSIGSHPSVSFAAAATHPKTLPLTQAPPVTVGGGHGAKDCPDRDIIIIQKPRERADGRGLKYLSFGHNADETSDIWKPEGQPKMVRATGERSDDEWVHRPSGMYHIERCECSEGRDRDGEEEDEFTNSSNRRQTERPIQTGVKSRMPGPRRVEREDELTKQQIAEIESAFTARQTEKEEETESKKEETEETTYGALLHKLREVEADPTLG
uniref:Retrotransposon gag domain-containing protein n=1 Tax=Chromera velia CCMP2878 TaxID=1169474 RepID=A0A0G4IFJ3_9ALVE|eukprot:Cvel_2453.t1-p1 / transcript=Cvel_2453.t1 / gene=Cvel_2453 / organism=Chromera_velia_CCMP2878 / gene_product=hypothetical protein / transcript_product=hypothetical protein / location=Cvel_scaffold96:54409-55593(-) / protein_length=338 / sequence_SO=supercontig / SO=protein_coding / is_pseudo=false